MADNERNFVNEFKSRNLWNKKAKGTILAEDNIQYVVVGTLQRIDQTSPILVLGTEC